MKKAIVTLAIGKKYVRIFNRHCRNLWTEYARRHNFDLIVLTNPLDTSAKAQSRSPAWQKCLILSQPELSDFEQVVWLDSDILINPSSPDVCHGVPIDKIGAVDCYATPSKEEYRVSLERLYEQCSKIGIPFVSNLTPTEYHTNFGLEGQFESVVQTGVLVLSPKHHKDLLERVYHNYEDKGGAHWNYEMRPLSYEILKHNLAHWLDPKFNMGWPYIKQSLYPFICPKTLVGKGLEKFGITHNPRLRTKCATTAFLNNYFLHFAGSACEMKFVNTKTKSIFDL